MTNYGGILELTLCDHIPWFTDTMAMNGGNANYFTTPAQMTNSGGDWNWHNVTTCRDSDHRRGDLIRFNQISAWSVSPFRSPAEVSQSPNMEPAGPDIKLTLESWFTIHLHLRYCNLQNRILNIGIQKQIKLLAMMIYNQQLTNRNIYNLRNRHLTWNKMCSDNMEGLWRGTKESRQMFTSLWTLDGRESRVKIRSPIATDFHKLAPIATNLILKSSASEIRLPFATNSAPPQITIEGHTYGVPPNNPISF